MLRFLTGNEIVLKVYSNDVILYHLTNENKWLKTFCNRHNLVQLSYFSFDLAKKNAWGFCFELIEINACVTSNVCNIKNSWCKIYCRWYFKSHFLSKKDIKKYILMIYLYSSFIRESSDELYNKIHTSRKINFSE